MSSLDIERVRKSFPSDVARHTVNISGPHGDTGLTLISARGDGFFAWFDIVSWADTLTITGDMGTFTFRAHGASDMLEFFRRGDKVNLPYFAEKVQAGVAEQFDQDKVRHALCGWARDTFEPDRYDYPDDDYLLPRQIEKDHEEKVAQVMRAAERDVFYRPLEDESDACEAVRSFEYEGHSPGIDCYEWTMTEYTVQYVWCCLAVRWAAQQVLSTQAA